VASFLNILEVIPGPIGTVTATIDGVVSRIQNAIATVEANNPVGDGQLKAAAVQADFQSAIDLAQQIAKLEGKTMVYDQAAFSAAVNAQVAAFNAFSTLKASFKLVDTPK
jgi:C4-type Zn-finger protein